MAEQEEDAVKILSTMEDDSKENKRPESLVGSSNFHSSNFNKHDDATPGITISAPSAHCSPTEPGIPDITISAPSRHTSPTDEGENFVRRENTNDVTHGNSTIKSKKGKKHSSKGKNISKVNNVNVVIHDAHDDQFKDDADDEDLREAERVGGLSEEDESDEDKEPEMAPYPSIQLQRDPNPSLPDTVTTLETPEGSKVYVVGTAHFSHSSQEDVAKTILATQPDVVMVELCSSRVNILQLDEETLLQEAKNINLDKVRTAIRQSGMVQGVLHLLLLNMSAHLTKQLGMAPGGEFRRAFREAQKIPGCRIQLGDRPIQITLRRALGSLSWWQKLRLAYYMITSKEPINAEEVEKCKQKDLLEEMLREMTGEFPALSQVFVAERDMFLSNSLRIAAQQIADPNSPTGYTSSVVVGVVGIGHVQGIVENWGKDCDIRSILRVPAPSRFAKVSKWTLRAGVVAMLSWGCYKLGYRLFQVGASLIPLPYKPALVT